MTLAYGPVQDKIEVPLGIKCREKTPLPPYAVGLMSYKTADEGAQFDIFLISVSAANEVLGFASEAVF
jgi:hypothetical protein